MRTQIDSLRTILSHSLIQARLDQRIDHRRHREMTIIADNSDNSAIADNLNRERDPRKLAGLRDYRIKASEETVAKSLVGDYRPEHLFTLRQSLDAWRYHRKLIADRDGIEPHFLRFKNPPPFRHYPRLQNRV